MNRDEALGYLAGQFSDIANLVGLNQSDTPADYGLVIDQSLRQLGYAETSLATANETVRVLDYLALLDYYALKRFLRPLSLEYDYSIDGESHKRSSLYANVEKQMLEAKEQLGSLGYQIDVANSFELGRMNFDFLEPSEAD